LYYTFISFTGIVTQLFSFRECYKICGFVAGLYSWSEAGIA